MPQRINLEHLCDDYIICSCEGASEETIMNILIDNNKLIFSRENLVDNKLFRYRKASEIEEKLLRRGYGKSISILRVSDSKNEKFKLSRLYEERVKVYTFLTRPEIEVLLLIGEGKDTKYFNSYKSSMKPSEYCNQIFHNRKYSIKSKEFIENYFADPDFLVETIRIYNEKYRGRDPLNLFNVLHCAL